MSINKTEQFWEITLKYFNNYWKIPNGFGKIIGVSMTLIERNTKLKKLETFKILKKGNNLITKWNDEHEYPINRIIRTIKQLKIEDICLDILITYVKETDKMTLTIMNDNIDFDIYEIEYIMEMEDLQNVTVHDNIRVWHGITLQDYYDKKISDYNYSFMEEEGTLISYDDDEDDHKKPKSPFWKK